MVCKIEHCSEVDYIVGSHLNIEDDLATGDEIYITHKYTMKVENMFRINDMLTIVDGSSIIKLRVL